MDFSLIEMSNTHRFDQYQAMSLVMAMRDYISSNAIQDDTMMTLIQEIETAADQVKAETARWQAEQRRTSPQVPHLRALTRQLVATRDALRAITAATSPRNPKHAQAQALLQRYFGGVKLSRGDGEARRVLAQALLTEMTAGVAPWEALGLMWLREGLAAACHDLEVAQAANQPIGAFSQVQAARAALSEALVFFVAHVTLIYGRVADRQTLAGLGGVIVTVGRRSASMAG
ncbi:hypothetical protein KKB55_09765 [Myxococcota bacterium]|nr:hypothetical protein [Myxococcota bacterium]